MGGISNIIEGHLNELLDANKSISQPRIKICNKCPLKKYTFFGYICNNKAWLNPETDDFSLQYKDGYVKGCGCRINAKVTVVNEKCPAGKW